MAMEGGRPPDPWFRGNPWLWLLALGALVLLGLVVYLAIVTGDEEAETRATVTEVETETATATVVDEQEGEEEVLVVVPALVGMDYAEAHEAAEEEGLIADSHPVEADEARGTVVAQSPASATEVPPTRRVELSVSVGTDARPELRVPDATGPQAETARRIAIETGFTVRTADRDAPGAEEVGEVILQRPQAGSRAPALTQITLFVGR